MQVKTFWPRCAPSACDRPTIVVDLPSPSGVGVIAVTSMYLPFGRLASRSRTSRWTLALYGPNSSSSLGFKPTSSAICRIGLSLQACAMSMSLGTGVRSFNLVGTNLTACLVTFLAALVALAFTLALASFAVLTAIVSLLEEMGFGSGEGSNYYYILPVNPLVLKWRMSQGDALGVTPCHAMSTWSGRSDRRR